MKQNIPIFLSSDDNYAPLVASTMASICYNTKEYIKFYILSDEISCFHKKVLFNFSKTFSNCLDLEFIDIDRNAFFSVFPIDQCFPKSSYSRILIQKFFKNYKRILYSDVDVIFLGDISEFYEQPLDDYALGAVEHTYFYKKGSQKKELFNRLELSAKHKYFYSGNLLIDCIKWHDLNISEQLLEIGKKKAPALMFGDQDILNIFFDSKFKLLDNRFCFTTQDCEYLKKYDKNKYKEISSSIIVRHFETRRKPWLTNMYQKNSSLENFEDFWFFASMTPFYHGLKQNFLASILHDDPPEYFGNIIMPNKKILSQLRTKVYL